MLIDSTTKYSEFEPFEPYMLQADLQRLKQAAEQRYGNCYNLSIDEFIGISSGDWQILGDMSEPTVLQIYWQKRFEDFCRELDVAFERMTIKPTGDEQALQAGTIKLQAVEAMLVFVRSYFGLHSFTEAGKITMGEFLTAKKDDYNRRRVERNSLDKQRRDLQRRK